MIRRPCAIVVFAVLLMAACGSPSSAPPAGGPSRDGAAGTLVTPPPARTVIAAAVSQAKAEGKVVLVEFGASWCKWCTNFQTFVHSADAGAIMTDNYVITTLVVKEDDDKKMLEHPGGADVLAEWGGAEAGIPFYVFLDADGRKIADSNAMPDGGNIGFPVSAEEVGAFLGLLDKTAARLTPTERATVAAYLAKPPAS